MDSRLSSLTRDELQQLYRILQDYRSAYRQIGERAEITDPTVARTPSLIIETVSKQDATEHRALLDELITRAFPEASREAVEYVENPRLIWGARIFYGDDMVDVSFDGLVQKI